MLAGGTRGALALCLFVGAASTTAPARAQAPQGASGAAQPIELARMRYRQGVDAYDAGKYRVAVDYFLEADHLAPNAALSFNIARAYDKMNEPGATLRWYRDYLRRDPQAPDRASVEELIHGIEAKLAEQGVQQLTILSEPAGATVALDGLPRGVTPWTGEIAPGSHELQLNLSGYAPAGRRVELEPDRSQDVVITLSDAPSEPVAAPTPEPPPNNSYRALVPTAREGAAPADSRKRAMFVTAGWAGIGAGGAALGAGLVFEILRSSAENDAKKQTTQVAYADRLDAAESRQTAARVLVGTGAALAVAGGVFLWLGLKEPNRTVPVVAASCVPGACWSVVRGGF
jgi:hypothetical protein